MSMGTLRKRIILALLSVMLPWVTGCTRHSKREHYYLVATNINLPYWKTAADGFQAAAVQYGVTAEVWGPTSFDPQDEVKEFHTVAARKPTGILVSVANAELMQPEIDAAIAAGIPVITIDSDAPASHRLYFIGTNNLEAGRLGAARVAAQLNGKGNIVFFTTAGQPNLEERLKGYKDVLANSPGIKIVDVFDMKGDSGLAMDKAQEYLGKTGKDKIDAMICLEASAGKDVGEAYKRANAKDRLLVAMDVDTATLNLVKDGTIDSTISQKPYTMAFLGLKGLDDVHHYPIKPLAGDYGLDPFSPLPAFIDTGVSLIDKTNVDSLLNRHKNGAPPQP
jgi:ribose transport system substrate-binding protein